MIKNAFGLILLSMLCFLTGCRNETEKMCRIEIQGADNMYIAALDQQTQADVDSFFDEDQWTECEDIGKNIVPEYVISLYQEKTHTRIQAENTYEKIMEYTIYKDSDIIKTTISRDMVKSGFVSEEDLTMYYIGSENFFSLINNVVKP